MILLDANILIYAHAADSPFHKKAAAWLVGAMDRQDEIGLSWDTVLAFVRISTNPAAGSGMLTMAEAVDIVDSIISRSHVRLVVPTETHWKTLRPVINDVSMGHNLVMDAHLAALAIEHRATLCTNDGDFLRFKGLQLLNPVAQ